MDTVCFVNMKGGVAKTTLAVNLAHALAAFHDKRVLLVDLDPQFNATQCLLGGETYVQGREDGAHTVFQVFDDSPPPLVSSVSGVREREAIALGDIEPWPLRVRFDLLPGDLELHRLDMAAGQGRELRLKRYLQIAQDKAGYDVVIIDTPPTPSVWMISALLASQWFLVPVKPEPLSATGIDLLRGVIQRCSESYAHEVSCIGVVLTIAEEETISFRRTCRLLDSNENWRGKRFKAVLPKRAEIAREQHFQKLIFELKDPGAKRSLSQIAREFLARLEGDDGPAAKV